MPVVSGACDGGEQSLKSRVISSNLNGILSFGFSSRWTIDVYRSDRRGVHRGKHLPLSHINRVVPDLAARFIPCPGHPTERCDRGNRLKFD
jgi:hypothetical protein